MSDNNSFTNKIRNPLLNVSVTGATFEELSQNAILCPVPVSELPPELNVSTTAGQQVFQEIVSSEDKNTFSTVFDNQKIVSDPNINNSLQTSYFLEPSRTEFLDNTSSLHKSGSSSSLSNVFFSSFKNVLNFGGQDNVNNENNADVSEIQSSLNNPPLDQFIQSPQTSVPLLFDPTSFNSQPLQSLQPLQPLQPPPPAQGISAHTFRRQNQKRVAYAPIPGLASAPKPNILIPQVNTNLPLQLNVPPPSQLAPPSAPLANLANSFPSIPFYGGNQQFGSGDLKALSNSILEPESIQSLDSTSSPYFNTMSGPISEVDTSFTPASLDTTPRSPTSGFYSNSSSSSSQTISEMASASTVNTSAPTTPYRAVYHHWFYRREIEGKVLWQPFSMVDSLALENAFTSADLSPEDSVETDGGRYDVNILRRQRTPVYWTGVATEVRRCSWFYKGTANGSYTPYEENIATNLEEEYKTAYESNLWHRRVELPNGEAIVFQAPDILLLFPSTTTVPDAWNNSSPTAPRPRIVKRGMDEFDIDEGEPAQIDHILFLVHGIGSACDLKFRVVEEVVDDFRSIALQLVRSHYRSSCERGVVNRVEVLPVGWHNQLHSEDTGIDRKLKSITLESIPRLRGFTNDTLLDILFYTSPIYCQTIISTVGNELNRIYDLFKQRNPAFTGGVSLGGHSLGSLILFDLLGHQRHIEKDDDKTEDDEDMVPPMKLLNKPQPDQRRMSRRISYMMGSVGTGQPQLIYPHLNFHPTAFFALGSPIGMFVTVRGLDSLGEQFALPTCPRFFNIFHPYDPVAYRIESLVNSELTNIRPVLIPHHKGRKRMHLELKETVARVGADLKQRIVDSMRNTWNSVYQLALFHRSEKSLEEEVDKVLEEQLEKEKRCSRSDSTCEEEAEINVSCGILNGGRRIDYVLQEAPFEIFNEYIFALTSHVCYWQSEDTMLLMLKEIYCSMGISTDSKIPQQTMTIERPLPSSVLVSETKMAPYVDPLKPISENPNLGPPPVSGFVRKT